MKPDTSFVLKSGHFHLLTTLKGRRSSCAMSTRNSQERNVRNCLTDEGRPLEVGLQERTSNHLSAAVDKSHGRGAETKRPGETGSGVRQEEDCKETTIEVSKAIRRCQNRGVITTAGQS